MPCIRRPRGVTEYLRTSEFTSSYGAGQVEPSSRRLFIQDCAPHSQAIELLRAYNAQTIDHFYTTDVTEMNTVLQSGYVREASPGRVFPAATTGTVPLLHAHSSLRTDSYYTANVTEFDLVVNTHANYQAEGITGYVYASQVSGSIPFYHAYKQNIDNFYTTNLTEWINAVDNLGYTAYPITAYILPL